LSAFFLYYVFFLAYNKTKGVKMSNNSIDPNMLREAAAAISKSMTADKARQESDRRIEEEVKEKIGHAPTVRCDNCGYHVWTEAVLFKRFTADESPTKQEMLTPVQTFMCARCRHTNSEFLPSHLTMDIEKKDEQGLPTY
jgi:hypothetical protein